MNSIETIGNLAVAGILLAPVVATGLRIAAVVAIRATIARRAPAPKAPRPQAFDPYAAVRTQGHVALRPSPVPADIVPSEERPTLPASAVVVRAKEGATVAGLDAVQVGGMRWNPGTRRWG